ncbi:MAG: Histidinol-phosphate aminotransferase [Myxococcaceae bacterium]|nr:Histidinol-phosphate aminotransferase [Myxococcaceae bacterium]
MRSVFAALLRPELDELRSYVPVDPPGIEVRLDANEAPAPDDDAIGRVVREALASVRLERYPDARALALKEAIARRTGAPVEALLVGSGSDEIIALLATALARPRGKSPQAVVMTPSPTFVMYRVTARGHGLKPLEVPLDASWDLDAAGMKRALDFMPPNIVYIASPNNPTGNRVSTDRLEAICDAAPDALVVLDEAYVDYAAGGSLRALRDRHPNLGVLRTLSKIGLAALRVGWLEAEPALVRELDKVRQPFNLSATSQAAACAVLDHAWEHVTAATARIVAERARVTAALSALAGVETTPSDANFVWVKVPRPAEEVHAALAARGVLVRSFHATGGRLARQLRITIGRPEENARMLAALTEALA